MMAVLHQELTLDLNADSAEWCPNANFTDVLAVGTYQLDESTNARNGRSVRCCSVSMLAKPHVCTLLPAVGYCSTTQYCMLFNSRCSLQVVRLCSAQA